MYFVIKISKFHCIVCLEILRLVSCNSRIVDGSFEFCTGRSGIRYYVLNDENVVGYDILSRVGFAYKVKSFVLKWQKCNFVWCPERSRIRYFVQNEENCSWIWYIFLKYEQLSLILLKDKVLGILSWTMKVYLDMTYCSEVSRCFLDIFSPEMSRFFLKEIINSQYNCIFCSHILRVCSFDLEILIALVCFGLENSNIVHVVRFLILKLRHCKCIFCTEMSIRSGKIDFFFFFSWNKKKVVGFLILRWRKS